MAIFSTGDELAWCAVYLVNIWRIAIRGTLEALLPRIGGNESFGDFFLELLETGVTHEVFVVVVVQVFSAVCRFSGCVDIWHVGLALSYHVSSY